MILHLLGVRTFVKQSVSENIMFSDWHCGLVISVGLLVNTWIKWAVLVALLGCFLSLNYFIDVLEVRRAKVFYYFLLRYFKITIWVNNWHNFP